MRQRAVLVHRRTELEGLLDRYVTRGQVEFFLSTRGRSLDQVQDHHDAVKTAVSTISAAIPEDWALALVEREDLPRFLWEDQDLVIVIGQDGLVANVAKYLTGQLVIGVNPEPGQVPGVLVRHSVAQTLTLIGAPLAAAHLTMVRARLDDGQELTALNEIYVGHASHQSARYVLNVGGHSERQSSSGLIVSTGTGATGWSASLAHDRGITGLPARDKQSLAWFVREAWPSPTTGVSLTSGAMGARDVLETQVESDELVIFGDGMEHDRITAHWGQTIRTSIADQKLQLV